MSRINYFSYAFCNDIKLTSGTDTVDCALFHYENSYGGTPVARFLLAFDDKKIGEDKTLIISDKIFNKGKIKLNMDKKVFDELPILNF